MAPLGSPGLRSSERFPWLSQEVPQGSRLPGAPSPGPSPRPRPCSQEHLPWRWLFGASSSGTAPRGGSPARPSSEGQAGVSSTGRPPAGSSSEVPPRVPTPKGPSDWLPGASSPGPLRCRTANLLTRSDSLTPALRSRGLGPAPPDVSLGPSSEGPRVSSTGLPRLNPPRRALPRATPPGALLVAPPRRNLHGLQPTKCTQWGSPEPLGGPPSVGHPPAPAPEGLPSSGSSEPLLWETLLESSRAPPPRRDARQDTSRDLLARLLGAGPRGSVSVRSSWSVPDEQR